MSLWIVKWIEKIKFIVTDKYESDYRKKVIIAYFGSHQSRLWCEDQNSYCVIGPSSTSVKLSITTSMKEIESPIKEKPEFGNQDESKLSAVCGILQLIRIWGEDENRNVSTKVSSKYLKLSSNTLKEKLSLQVLTMTISNVDFNGNCRRCFKLSDYHFFWCKDRFNWLVNSSQFSFFPKLFFVINWTKIASK